MPSAVRFAAFRLLACAAFLSTPSAVPAQSYTNGVVARWTFDDGTGKDSAGANDMALVGSPNMVPSPLGQAMETRSTAYAVADSPGLNITGWTGITVSVWVMPVTGFTTYGVVFSRGADSSGGAFALIAPAANNFASQFGIALSATQGEVAVYHLFTPSKAPYPVIGNWYHLVGTYDGQTIRTYVNGVLDESKNVSIPGRALWEPAGSRTYIGTGFNLPNREWSDDFFRGDFDEVAIWNRALSPAEVSLLFLANTQQVAWVAASVRENVPPARSTPRYNPHANVPVSAPTPPPERVAPPREDIPKLVSYTYDARTAKGVLSVNIANEGMEARDWVIKNIGKIASSKELLLEAGKEPADGGRYKVLNESLKDGILTVEFEVLH